MSIRGFHNELRFIKAVVLLRSRGLRKEEGRMQSNAEGTRKERAAGPGRRHATRLRMEDWAKG